MATQKFSEMPVYSFSEARDHLARHLKKQKVACFLGYTGVGKTEMVMQFAAAKKMDFVHLFVSQLEPADFLGLPKIDANGRTTNCAPAWLPMAENTNPNGGIIFLDEVNRGHEDIRQALYQFLSYRKIHTYSLPENYYIVAAANPADGVHETYEFDDALMERFRFIKFKPNLDETLEYLDSVFGKNLMLSWVRTDSTIISYEGSAKGVVPRSLKDAIEVYIDDEKEGVSEAILRKDLQADLGSLATLSFMKFREAMSQVSVEDIILGKSKDKQDVLFEVMRIDVLSTLMTDLAHLFSEIGDVTKSKHKLLKDKDAAVLNVANFIARLPQDMIQAFVDHFKTEAYRNQNCILHVPEFAAIVKPKAAKSVQAVAKAIGATTGTTKTK